MANVKKLALIAGGVGLAVYLASKFGRSAGAAVGLFAPASVKAGETFSANTYRVIAAQRSGLTYVPVNGSVGGQLSFASSVTGQFTRNVVVSGNQVLAEIAPA